MRLPRIYIANKLHLNREIVLNDDISNYLIRVLRLKKGRGVIAFNETDGEYLASMTADNPQKTKIVLRQIRLREDVESPIKIHLAQALLHREKMDYVVQKSSELGVTYITPVATEYSKIEVSSANRLKKRTQRWQKIAISSTEQSGRLRVPTIMPIQNLFSWIKECKVPMKILLQPESEYSLVKLLRSLSSKTQDIVLAVGPEGGFSEKEIEIVQKYDFKFAHIGKRILRTETAALVGITIVQTLLGDLN